MPGIVTRSTEQRSLYDAYRDKPIRNYIHLVMVIFQCNIICHSEIYFIFQPATLHLLWGKCHTQYSSTVTYSATAKELIALSYAIASITGCASTGVGNDYLQNEVRESAG